jgi:hypothetical protein
MFAPTIAVIAALAAAPSPTVSQALRIAYRADPQAPCAGFVAVQWDATLGDRGRDGETLFYAADGKLRPLGCMIVLDPALNEHPARRCDVIVHEVKHLAGYEHTRTGIMRPGTGRWPACHRWDRKHRVKRHGNRFDSR